MERFLVQIDLWSWKGRCLIQTCTGDLFKKVHYQLNLHQLSVKVRQIKLLYLYCLVVVEFSESEADELEMALPRQTRNKKKGVSN